MGKLLVTIKDIALLTGLDGNIDNNTIEPFIILAQNREVKRVLGVPLYDKLTTDFENNIPFTGVYDTIFYKYVVHLHSHYTASYYYSLGLVKSSQNGAYYVTPEKTERISEEKAHKLASDYKGIAMGLETELIAYLETLSIPEWVVKTKARKPLNWIKL